LVAETSVAAPPSLRTRQPGAVPSTSTTMRLKLRSRSQARAMPCSGGDASGTPAISTVANRSGSKPGRESARRASLGPLTASATPTTKASGSAVGIFQIARSSSKTFSNL
jgi:hypothetical protein